MELDTDENRLALTHNDHRNGDVIITNGDVMKKNGDVMSKQMEALVQNGDVTARRTNHLTPEVTTYMVLKTISLVLSFTVMGMFLEIVGPTLPDLMVRVNVNFEEISRALVTHSIGYFISSMLGGLLTDRFPAHVELFLSVAFFLAAIGTGLVPLMSDLRLLACLLLLRGLSQGCIDTFCNFLCMKIWQSKASSPVHALHFGFGIGAFIVPQIVRPFLANPHIHYNSTLHEYIDQTGYYEVDIISNSSESPFSNRSYISNIQFNNNMTANTLSAIEVPYSICAALAGSFAIFYLVFYAYERKSCQEKQPLQEEPILKKPKKNRNLLNILSPGSCSDGHPCFGMKLFILMFFFHFNLVGCENAVGRFLYSFATEGELGFDTDKAANLNSLFWICFTCGRGLTMLIARWVPQHVMLIVEASLNLLCGIILACWGYNSTIVIWIFIGLLAMSLSPCIPSGLSWINQYLVMRGISFAVFFCGGASGGMFYQWFTGYLFQRYGPYTLLYIVLGYSILLGVTVILMQLVVCKKKGRFEMTVIDDIIIAEEDAKPINT